MSTDAFDRHITGDFSYRRRPGSGPSWLLLHGIGSNADSFVNLVSHLPVDWDIVAWDAPGYKQSVRLKESRPTAQHYATALCDFIAQVALTNFYLLGHSLGTLMAISYCQRNIASINGLALLGCAQGGGIRPDAPLPEKYQQRLDDLNALGTNGFAATRAPGLVFQPQSEPELVEDIRAVMSAIETDGYADAVSMLAAGDLAGDASSVQCDTVVMVGLHDSVTPPVQSRIVHDALTLAAPDHKHDYLELPGAGHAVHQQQPQAVAEQLAGFSQ